MTRRIAKKTSSYKITLDNLEILISKIKDLTKLNKSVCIKIDNNNILLYSLVGKGVNIHAFKSHIQTLKETFSVIKDELEEEIIYKIEDAKRFVTSMTVFVKYMISQEILDDIEFKMTYFDNFIVEKLLIKNQKSKEETPGEIPKKDEDVDINQIDELMNIELTNYSFNLIEEDFKYIKAKTVIEKENEVLYLNIKDNNLSIGETRWEHNICDCNQEDETKSFPKKYFKCINYDIDKSMKIYVADSYLIILGDTSNLLISVEFSV